MTNYILTASTTTYTYGTSSGTGAITNLTLLGIPFTTLSSEASITSLTQGFGLVGLSATYGLAGQAVQFTGTLNNAYGIYGLVGESTASIRTYILSSNSGTYTQTGKTITGLKSSILSLLSGTYTQTGGNNLIDYNRLFAASYSDYYLVKNSALLEHGRFISPNFTAYTQTGEAATSYIGFGLHSTYTTYTQTGEAVSFIKLYDLNPVSGTYNQTGNTANFIANILFNALGSTYSMTTGTVLLEQPKTMPASFDTFGIIGYTSVANRMLYANYTTFNQITYLAQIHVNLFINALTTTYNYTGSIYNSVLKEYKIYPATNGTYSITGEAANLLKGYWLNLTGNNNYRTKSTNKTDLYVGHGLHVFTEYYTFTTESNLLEYHRLFPVANGTFAETGEANNFLYGRAIINPAGSYTLTGDVSNLLYNHVIYTDYGTHVYILTPHLPRLETVMPAAYTTFTMTDYAASVFPTRKIYANKGRYIFKPIAVGYSENYILSAINGNYVETGIATAPRNTITDIIVVDLIYWG